MATSSFGATNIRIELDGNGGAPQWQRQGYVATRHIPGGNSDVTQVMGYGSRSITLNLWLEDAEWALLEAQLLSTETLVMADTSYSNVLLEALSPAQPLTAGWVSVQATFREVGA